MEIEPLTLISFAVIAYDQLFAGQLHCIVGDCMTVLLLVLAPVNSPVRSLEFSNFQ